MKLYLDTTHLPFGARNKRLYLCRMHCWINRAKKKRFHRIPINIFVLKSRIATKTWIKEFWIDCIDSHMNNEHATQKPTLLEFAFHRYYEKKTTNISFLQRRHHQQQYQKSKYHIHTCNGHIVHSNVFNLPNAQWLKMWIIIFYKADDHLYEI